MRTSLIALAAALGIAFAAAAGSLAQDRHGTAGAGRLDEGKRAPTKLLRASPESHGATLDAGDVIFF